MKIIDVFLELLYPTRCAFCHRLTEGGQKVCPKCRKELPYTAGLAQRQKLRQVEVCLAPLYYENSVRDSLLRYKFKGLTGYAEIYGEILAKCVDENEISCDIITWVPLSRKRLRRRGYDQAGLLAEDLACRLGLPCEPLLRKRRDNPAQSGQGAYEKRRENVRGVYEAQEPERVNGRRVLLVDDIVTTGATLSECAAVLKAAGAATVRAAAVARRRD